LRVEDSGDTVSVKTNNVQSFTIDSTWDGICDLFVNGVHMPKIKLASSLVRIQANGATFCVVNIDSLCGEMRTLNFILVRSEHRPCNPAFRKDAAHS
jgi:hypothetical protein